jgi:enoyl-CoA hydratase
MNGSYATTKWSVDEGIALVTINRPEALNALNSQVFAELGSIFTELEKNREVRVVILTGAGEKAFAAGADIKEEQQCSVMEARDFAMLANYTQGKIEAFPRPVIAAVNGFALGGGCEVAMCCDIRIASVNAKFGQPEINLGIIPGGGGTQRLPRLIGLGRAKELIYTGEMIDAQRAYEIGLVNKVVPLEDLINEARTLAAKIARKSLPILMLAKDALSGGAGLDLDKALKFEIECFANCFGTEDHDEGIAAFIEKRKPSFKDK